MVQIRSQLENLSKEELFEELTGVEGISSKLYHLFSCFNDILKRYEILSSELFVTKNCNSLSERIAITIPLL